MLQDDRLAWSRHRYALFPAVSQVTPESEEGPTAVEAWAAYGPIWAVEKEWERFRGLQQAFLDLLDGYSPSPLANLKFNVREKHRTSGSLNLCSWAMVILTMAPKQGTLLSVSLKSKAKEERWIEC